MEKLVINLEFIIMAVVPKWYLSVSPAYAITIPSHNIAESTNMHNNRRKPERNNVNNFEITPHKLYLSLMSLQKRVLKSLTPSKIDN